MATDVAAKSGRSTFIANSDRSNCRGFRNREVTSRHVARRAKLRTISVTLRRTAALTSCATLTWRLLN
jgi:hypothetical protein